MGRRAQRFGTSVVRALATAAALLVLSAAALPGDPAPAAPDPAAWRIEDAHAASSIALSPDETLVVAGGEDGTARVFDVSTGKLLREMKGHKGAIVRTEFVGGDREWLATFSSLDRVRVWNTTTGAMRKEFAKENVQVSYSTGPSGMAAAPSGHVVLIGRTSSFHRWDGDGTARKIALPAVYTPAGLALSSNGSRCAAVDASGAFFDKGWPGGLSIDDAASGAECWRIGGHPSAGTDEEQRGLEHGWTQWRWSPDDRVLVLLGNDSDEPRGAPARGADLGGHATALLRCYEVSSMTVKWELSVKDDRIADAVFAPGGGRAVVVTRASAFDLDVEKGVLTKSADLAPLGVACVAYGPKSAALYVGTSKGTLLRFGATK